MRKNSHFSHVHHIVPNHGNETLQNVHLKNPNECDFFTIPKYTRRKCANYECCETLVLGCEIALSMQCDADVRTLFCFVFLFFLRLAPVIIAVD